MTIKVKDLESNTRARTRTKTGMCNTTVAVQRRRHTPLQTHTVMLDDAKMIGISLYVVAAPLEIAHVYFVSKKIWAQLVSQPIAAKKPLLYEKLLKFPI